jgi:hypothetical protein
LKRLKSRRFGLPFSLEEKFIDRLLNEEQKAMLDEHYLATEESSDMPVTNGSVIRFPSGEQLFFKQCGEGTPQDPNPVVATGSCIFYSRFMKASALSIIKKSDVANIIATKLYQNGIQLCQLENTCLTDIQFRVVLPADSDIPFTETFNDYGAIPAVDSFGVKNEMSEMPFRIALSNDFQGSTRNENSIRIPFLTFELAKYKANTKNTALSKPSYVAIDNVAASLSEKITINGKGSMTLLMLTNKKGQNNTYLPVRRVIPKNFDSRLLSAEQSEKKLKALPIQSSTNSAPPNPVANYTVFNPVSMRNNSLGNAGDNQDEGEIGVYPSA